MIRRKLIELARVRSANERAAQMAADEPELLGTPSRANRTRWEENLEAIMADPRSGTRDC